MNFKELCAICCTTGCIFFFLLFVPGNALAATVHGTVYEWYTFEPLENTVIEVNSTPAQYFVASDSAYSFNLPPGNYLITARYFEQDRVIYETEETVTISEDGDYVLDFLLFPIYEEELLNQSELENLDQDFKETELVAENGSWNTAFAFFLLSLSTLLLVGYFWKKRPKNASEIPSFNEAEIVHRLSPEDPSAEVDSPEKVETGSGNFVKIPKEDPELPFHGAAGEEAIEPENTNVAEKLLESWAKPSEDESEEPDFSVPPRQPENSDTGAQDNPENHLPPDLKEVMEIIRANGNRITQSELRKKSRYSESKVSLMLSDLEERGLIEKYKKGRGNILQIPEDQ